MPKELRLPQLWLFLSTLSLNVDDFLSFLDLYRFRLDWMLRSAPNFEATALQSSRWKDELTLRNTKSWKFIDHYDYFLPVIAPANESNNCRAQRWMEIFKTNNKNIWVTDDSLAFGNGTEICEASSSQRHSIEMFKHWVNKTIGNWDMIF